MQWTESSFREKIDFDIILGKITGIKKELVGYKHLYLIVQFKAKSSFTLLSLNKLAIIIRFHKGN